MSFSNSSHAETAVSRVPSRITSATDLCSCSPLRRVPSQTSSRLSLLQGMIIEPRGALGVCLRLNFQRCIAYRAAQMRPCALPCLTGVRPSTFVCVSASTDELHSTHTRSRGTPLLAHQCPALLTLFMQIQYLSGSGPRWTKCLYAMVRARSVQIMMATRLTSFISKDIGREYSLACYSLP